MKGFTFVEIIIAVAVVAFLMILIVPWGINFYNTQQLDDTSQEIVQALRRAQLQAMTGSFDSSFGVYFGLGYYALFRGNSYVAKTDEESFSILSAVSFSGLSEIVFSKLTGVPNKTGNIILKLGKDSRTININSIGRINLQ